MAHSNRYTESPVGMKGKSKAFSQAENPRCPLSSKASLLAVVLIICICSLPLGAQVDTGAIVGHVSDASGGQTPGAKVTVKEENTGFTNMVMAGSDGSYTFSPLKIGIYTLTVEKENFKTSVQQHIEVTIQSHIELNPILEVGTVSESVQVTSAAPILETQSSSLQELVDTRTINNLPLNGRNASFLAQLAPGVTFSQHDTRNLAANGSFSANGEQRAQNNYLLDGMDNNAEIADLVNQSQYVVMPPPDALREFTVQTSNYSAEFGHSAGAVLNVSTKSGTNSLHGDLWEYLRNDMFDAKDYFVLSTQSKPKFRQNQFGGTLGGPVIIPHLYNGHDRTFFFVDYQGFRNVQGKTYAETVPTAGEQNSNFTNLQDLINLQSGTTSDLLGRTFPIGTVFDPMSTRSVTQGVADPVTNLAATATGYVRDPFYTGSLGSTTNFTSGSSIAQLNHIASSRIDPNAVALLHLFPLPNNTVLLNNFTTSPQNTQVTDSMDARVDQQFAQHDSMFLRFSYVNTTQFQASPFPGIADGSPSRPGSGFTESLNGAMGWTHIFTPHLVDEARVGYSRVYDRRLQPYADTLGLPAQYNIPGVPQFPGNGGLPLLEFNSLSAIGANTTLPSDKASDIFQVTDNYTIDRSHHQIRTGFEFQHIAYPLMTPPESRGDFDSTGLFTSVVNNTDATTDLAQFALLSKVSPYGAQFNYEEGADQLTASNYPPAYYPIRNYDGAYVEDLWRVTQILTLNLGLRYEFLGVPAERDGRVGNLVPAKTGDTPDGLTHYYIPQKNIASLSPAFLALLTSNNVVLTPTSDNAIGIAQRTNFAPRLGFALQPMPKMSIRGGYGLFYQANESHGLSSSPFVNFPFSVQSSYAAGSAIQAIIANPITDTTPEGTVGPISQGLQNVPLDPAIASVSSLQFEGEPRYPKTSYTQAYNLQTQYQLSASTLAFVGYIGDNSRHIQDRIPTNTTSQITAPSTPLSGIAFFPTIATGGQYVSHNGSGNYNSLQFGVERRFSSGFSFMANMTYSKCLGDIRDMLDATIGAVRAPYVPGVGLKADYTLCEIHIHRIFHASGTYELPFGKGHHFLNEGIGALIAGGWSTNWILTSQDGQPFSIPCTKTTASGLGCFALKVPGQNLYGGPHNVTQFLNPQAFANPPAVAAGTTGTIANLGEAGGQVTGPPFRRLNLSIVRRFPFIRGSSFEFRADVFNLTNTPNFGTPGSLKFTSPSSFAKISATSDSPNDQREIQLSLKYIF
jgi:hypothetical protein